MCLTASHLHIGYNHDTVVAGIDLALPAGQSLALVGTNGSGKSTLLKTMVGLINPQQGKISIFDQKPGSLPRRVAYLSQFHVSGFVLPLRAIDVVRMGCFARLGLWGRATKHDEEMVREAMERMGISHLANTPLWYLSGGQQQRTYIAQALAHRADLLVLDEPTAGLDAGGQEVFLQAMHDELSRGAALVTATHDIKEASACDMVMLLARKVVALGKPQDIMTPELLLRTFGIQIPHH
ncbi:MAG: metal ABC transporter ATP-binding protein [Dehalococcoidia bacterium]|nr:metal ABC transporter ATP-binding protein [Dehalococcoidia bacterium]